MTMRAKRNPTNKSSIDDLLMPALNKNQATFAQVSKSAETLSNGNLKLKLDSSGKMV